MIPQDIIQRVVRAHDAAVKAAQAVMAATPGTRNYRLKLQRYDRAEENFEAAMAALVDAAP